MKVFVLEGSSGQYDEYRTWIEGAFSKMETLEEYKQKYLKNDERIKNSPCPIDQEIYDQHDWYYKVSDEDFELVMEWTTKVNYAKEFNEFYIREMELDQEFKIKEDE